MRNGKYSKSTGYKSMALLLAMVLLVGCAIGGTLAWLTDKTDEVKNTFTTSNIDIELKETTTEYEMVPGWTIDKNPIVTVKKGSEDCYLFVKVEKSTNLDNYIAYNLETDRKEGEKAVWTKLDGVDNVYYIIVKASEVASADKTIHLLLAGSYTDPMGSKDDTTDDVTISWKQDQVATKPSVTKEMMEAVDGVDSDGKTETEAAKAEVAKAEVANRPSITFTAYASQLYKNNTDTFTAAQAWANVPKT